MVFQRFFTVWSFIAIFLLSMGVYYAFMWACNWVSISNTHATILQLHSTLLYYLTILLCVGLCFSVDLFHRAFIFNF